MTTPSITWNTKTTLTPEDADKIREQARRDVQDVDDLMRIPPGAKPPAPNPADVPGPSDWPVDLAEHHAADVAAFKALLDDLAGLPEEDNCVVTILTLEEVAADTFTPPAADTE